jgi:hypothetical protein
LRFSNCALSEDTGFCFAVSGWVPHALACRKSDVRLKMHQALRPMKEPLNTAALAARELMRYFAHVAARGAGQSIAWEAEVS